MDKKPTYEELKERVKELEKEAAKHKQPEEVLNKQAHDIRVKELDCLYGISQLVDKHEISLEEIIQGTVNLIPPAWQYPEITCARIISEGKEFKTENFRETAWKQTHDIKAYGKRAGILEIYYMEEREERDEGPFLKEERRNLLTVIAERLGRIIERMWADEKIGHLNLVLRAIRNVNQLITREKDRDGLVQGICDNLIENRGYHSVWITLMDEAGKVNTTAEAGWGRDFLPLIENIKRGELPDCAQKALSKTNVTVTKDPPSSCPDCPLAKSCVDRGAMTIGLEYGGKSHGLMFASIPRDFVLGKEEEALFKEVAEDISIALHSIELEEERRQTEETLRESEEKIRSIIEHSNEMFYIHDTSHNLSYVSRMSEKILGYTTEEMMRKWTELATHNPINQKGIEITEKAIETGKRQKPYLIELEKKDGTSVLFEIDESPIKDAEGKVVGITGAARDVTERKRAEDALKESEEKYRTILESIEEGYYEVDIAGNFTFFNDSMCRILGYSKDELMGMNNREYMDQENARKVYKEYNRVYNTGKPDKGFDWEFTRKDGNKGHVETSVSLMKDSEGHPTGFRGILRDVTERKRTEEALRESEERFRILVEESPLGISLIGKDGRYKYINPKFTEIFGYSLEDIPTGREWFRKAYPDEEYRHQVISKWITDLEKLKQGKSRSQAFNVTCKDGSEKIIQFSPVTMETGDQFLIYEDITIRKQAEAELIQTKNYLENICNSSIDGITTTDLHGNIIYASPGSKDTLGYDQNEIIGKKVYSLYENRIEDAKTIMKELEEKSELKNHEMKLIRKDGDLIDINLSASLLIDEKGDVIGTLGIYRDITEKKRLEVQLAQAQRMESIGTLAGGIAHNFNNLLMGIQGNASLMLLEADPNHPNYRRLNNIEIMVQSGSKLTSQLLGYAREGRYEVRPISFNQLVKDTSDTFDTTRKDIRVHQELYKDLPGIKADQGQIEQVLLNLYVNAADAMPGGGGLFLKTMNITHKDMAGKPYEPKPGNYVLLTVKDTGVGMDKETRERIFDPFFTTKGLAKGTGLGLTSVYGIIKAHGGYIDVESKKGQGTTFSVYLPATEKEVIKEKELPVEVLKGKETVLLVDDEDMIIDVGEQMLETLGYNILIARSGKEAIELYKESKDKIDMVLLDMVMPGVGGGETYDRMKEINPKVKVLLSSGYSIDGQATEILERGCSGFIQKPFNMGQLSQGIREILDVKGDVHKKLRNSTVAY